MGWGRAKREGVGRVVEGRSAVERWREVERGGRDGEGWRRIRKSKKPCRKVGKSEKRGLKRRFVSSQFNHLLQL